MGLPSPQWHLLRPLILILCSTRVSHSFIYAYLDTNSTGPEVFDDLPALFGPLLPLEGVKGYLIPAEPKNACLPIAPPPTKDNTTVFIALIQRYDCNFDLKVLNAQLSGYSAAIVHNVDSDKLMNMAGNDEHIRSQITIPSVFTGETAGRVLMEQFSYYDNAHVFLNPSYFLLGYYLIPLIVVVTIIITVTCVIMVVRCIQDRKRRGRNRLSKDQLKKIAVHKFKKGDAYDVCAICLEEYEEGDKLRVLPCSHAYHCSCVDRWLTKSKKTCPVCKDRVLRTDDDTDSEGGGDAAERAGEEEEDNERTPLLRPSPSPSFGSMAESPPAQQGEQGDTSTTAVAV
ncbi:E3 ubiquitin-protein ligase RNF167 [Mixophyes fleayi]|uniref:E3 ubiquitin-protein ligase RNF167 n=1 Tax=Mixophyes fleayi TaxID=3061075 RepID=UPI003F4DC2C3